MLEAEREMRLALAPPKVPTTPGKHRAAHEVSMRAASACSGAAEGRGGTKGGASEGARGGASSPSTPSAAHAAATPRRRRLEVSISPSHASRLHSR